ncbi:hypothetical protein C8R46DRAFT_36526 [Mycena filopes]|nr:hypothetical protein C8R46DRAFT_36526 [Mycena filopes]
MCLRLHPLHTSVADILLNTPGDSQGAHQSPTHPTAHTYTTMVLLAPASTPPSTPPSTPSDPCADLEPWQTELLSTTASSLAYKPSARRSRGRQRGLQHAGTISLAAPPPPKPLSRGGAGAGSLRIRLTFDVEVELQMRARVRGNFVLGVA